MLDVVLSRWLGAATLAIALFVAWCVSRVVVRDAPRNHDVALDGLRGYLAFGVLLHHAVIWHLYARTGRWDTPAGTPFRDYGVLCVSVFFMITGLLFVGKLLDARGRAVDWLGLYVGRLMRICPLYYAVICVTLCIVAATSEGHLRESWLDLISHVWAWLSFTFVAAPRVNEVPTGVLTAGVTWTLAYEWLFYLSLPLLALVLRCRPPWLLVLVASSFVAWIAFEKPFIQLPIGFLGGAVTALVVRQPRVLAALRTRAAACFAVLALGGALAGLYAHGLGRFLPWAVFCVVAAGNSIFGLLSSRAAVALGDVSYGIYLIHGLVLTAVLRFGLGVQRVATLDTLSYWGVIAAVAALVVLLASASYHFLERPAMSHARHVTAWLRRVFAVGNVGRETLATKQK